MPNKTLDKDKSTQTLDKDKSTKTKSSLTNSQTPAQTKSPLQTIFSRFRDKYKDSNQQRDKGTEFELLIQKYLQTDKVQQTQFSEVFTYSEFAEQNSISGKDLGIDLVAKNRHDDKYTAVQCKFYVKKEIIYDDINTFIAASSKELFSHRLLVDTTEKGLNIEAETAFNDSIPWNRIDITILENSSIDWNLYLTEEKLCIAGKKDLREHQKLAADKAVAHFNVNERGVLLMACGTGKTFTSLKIAEAITQTNQISSRIDLSAVNTIAETLIIVDGTPEAITQTNQISETTNPLILFLVPSLSLMNQTINEFAQNTDNLRALAVCSDNEVGKGTKTVKNRDESDNVEMKYQDLLIPVTTDAKVLCREFAKTAETNNQLNTTTAETENSSNAETQSNRINSFLTVVFCTYQSLQVIHEAQNLSFPIFSLIICDEAHRTTGVTMSKADSCFVAIHDAAYIKSHKRLYMTATPKIYAESTKDTAKAQDIITFSMDDTSKFGEVFYNLKFGEAVEKGLLTDYKLLILGLNQSINSAIQQLIADEKGNLTLDDATKMIGIYKALLGKDELEPRNPAIRSVNFCRNIKSSKSFTTTFNKVVEAYLREQDESAESDEYYNEISIKLKHIDGKTGVNERGTTLNWLKHTDNTELKILSNARCLSEGVDLPNLDAVIFLHGRKSKVDIVQAVGRVMRKAEGKKIGYIIIPVAIQAGADIATALGDNADYATIWAVVNALRAHDERLDGKINEVALLNKTEDKALVLKHCMEIISYIDKLPAKPKDEKIEIGKGSDRTDDNKDTLKETVLQSQELNFGLLQEAIYAKLVEKCGTRTYWEDWAADVSKEAEKQMQDITSQISTNPTSSQAFNHFVNELKNQLNDSITPAEVIEMLAQHIITKPVFNALFQDYSFTENNPISQSMQTVLKSFETQDTESLKSFYSAVQKRIEGISDDTSRQTIIIELYDTFFKKAFPRLTERLGIVYTPVECVDFIIHSVNDILKLEFQQELGDKNVHISDPFTGTGTFITRLIQSDVLTIDQLKYKYQTEIHANELVLLAYYIASINIESVYHHKTKEHKQFSGICLTDTFQLNEDKEDLLTSQQLKDNNERRAKQKKAPIRVIIGNPPYSAGQKSGNDNNQNVKYPKLDKSIEESYVKSTTATNKNSLYDSYIRAIRWASDRIKDSGVIGFITNAGWLDSNSADGLRHCLAKEFTSIYVFNLRGNARTSGEKRRQENGNIFGEGTRTPIAITILVKNPAKTEHNIYYYDIGDYLNRETKLKRITELKSVGNITKLNLWQNLIPDKYHDWLNQRTESFYEHIVLGNKKNKSEVTIFENYSRGLATSRDAWVYNYSPEKLAQNVQRMIGYYNEQLELYKTSDARKNQPKGKDAEKFIANYLHETEKKAGIVVDKCISWSRDYRYDISREANKIFDVNKIITALYRPFTKCYCFYDAQIAMELYQLPQIFPEECVENRVIGVSSIGANSFSILMSDNITDLGAISVCQLFPLYLYEPINDSLSIDEKNIFIGKSGKKYQRRDGITNAGLAHFANFYHEKITKEELFYHIYGYLHNTEYRTKYADNLTKALPRIPRVETFAEFKHYETLGRKLAYLHINYETLPMYDGVELFYKGIEFKYSSNELIDSDFYVTQMKFGKKVVDDKNVTDKTVIIFNKNITIKNIPLTSYNYVINGKSAIEWVMERQSITTHKDSSIENNANDYGKSIGNARYGFELLLRVVGIGFGDGSGRVFGVI